MTISRGQMNRQLYMRGGIMDAMPRQEYGLGSFVKKAVKGVTKSVKKIASSDVGKAALTGAVLFGIPGMGTAGGIGGGLLGRASFGGAAPGIFGFGGIGGALAAGKAKFFPNAMQKAFGKNAMMGDPAQFFSAAKSAGEGIKLGTVGKFAALAGVSTFLTGTLGMSEEQAEEELARDPSKYLELYYRNLNPPTADTNSEEYEAQVRDFVATNTSEYTAGQGGYAEGGRIGYAVGSDDEFPLGDPTAPVNPFGPKPPPGAPVLPDKMMASNMNNDKILEALFEKYLDMGLSPEKAAEKAREEFERMSMMKTEGRGLAALGGRMGFDEGTSSRGLMGSVDETMDIPMQDEEMVVIITMDEDGMPILKQVPRSQVMPKGVSDSGRTMKAKGDTASDNAMQAAGIEGLPVRQNPKGIKELDLRDNGGFIPPVGIKEKEDDIPAMLSNNEFVFTADAVRGMGDGNVNVGAQRMYDMMKKLEAGGSV